MCVLSCFSRDSPRRQTRVSCIPFTAGRFFTTEPPGKPIFSICEQTEGLFWSHFSVNNFLVPSLCFELEANFYLPMIRFCAITWLFHYFVKNLNVYFVKLKHLVYLSNQHILQQKHQNTRNTKYENTKIREMCSQKSSFQGLHNWQI